MFCVCDCVEFVGVDVYMVVICWVELLQFDEDYIVFCGVWCVVRVWWVVDIGIGWESVMFVFEYVFQNDEFFVVVMVVCGKVVFWCIMYNCCGVGNFIVQMVQYYLGYVWYG